MWVGDADGAGGGGGSEGRSEGGDVCGSGSSWREGEEPDYGSETVASVAAADAAGCGVGRGNIYSGSGADRRAGG